VERRKAEEQLQACASDGGEIEAGVLDFPGLAGRASVLVKTAESEDAHELVTTVTSDRVARGKSL
jgi:hypothetical protein